MAQTNFVLCSQDISQICFPLTLLGISFFQFSRIFNNGYKILLCNKSSWAEIISSSEIINVKGSLSVNPELLPEQILWRATKPNGVMKLIYEQYNCINGYSIIDKFKRYTDVYCFAADDKHEYINNIYLSNHELLIRFKNYFKDKVEKTLRNYAPKNCNKPNKAVIKNPINLEAYLKYTNSKHFYIKCHGKDCKITTREYQCIKLLSAGMSVKKIADELNINQRTVYQYLDSVKCKLELYSRDQLVHVFNNYYNI